jgi:hypothetical protein
MKEEKKPRKKKSMRQKSFAFILNDSNAQQQKTLYERPADVDDSIFVLLRLVDDIVLRRNCLLSFIKASHLVDLQLTELIHFEHQSLKLLME